MGLYGNLTGGRALGGAALKHGIRKRKRNHGNGNGIRERRFQAIDLKKQYVSNDNKITKQIKKNT